MSNQPTTITAPEATMTRKLTDVFATKPCTRCGGSGHYSYNSVDGSRCYGCSGSGLAWADKKTAAAVAEIHANVRTAKTPTVAKLNVGDTVLEGLAHRADGKAQWVTVVSITDTGRPSGWSWNNDRAPEVVDGTCTDCGGTLDAQRIGYTPTVRHLTSCSGYDVASTYVTVALSDGTEREVSTNSVVRRRLTGDQLPVWLEVGRRHGAKIIEATLDV